MSTSQTTLASNSSVSDASPVFQFKGGLFPLTSIQLLTPSLNLLGVQLDQKLQQAPKFFYNAPMVIDLQKIQRDETLINFIELKDILIKRNLVAVGVKNGSVAQHSAASQAGFAILQETVKETDSEQQNAGSVKKQDGKFGGNEVNVANGANESNETHEANKTKEAKVQANHTREIQVQGSNTRVITEPVRSGQQIYARGGDLIVLAAVSQGAELLADGHIHVYGPLRGRALAGVTGDNHAHIFCMSLESELISVAGQYKISEDIATDAWQKSVDIFLEDGRLEIRTL